ncbi:glycosyltransferase family 2 protein [Niallia sp. Krafla_26]|uniref:glycosyltransferase family 2 protein n=1 Tax=Niallia sp. Krafla_26 TaxID=3064703 RepID=UPI003D166018
MISVLILTYNEEKNIKQCLESLVDFSDDVYILDSYSDDRTIDYANLYLNTDKILYRKFDNYSNQRNWALRNINYKYEWVLMLDADEILTEEVKISIEENLKNVKDNVVGFSIRLRMYFLDKYLRYRLWPLKRKTIYRHKDVEFKRDINEHITSINPTRDVWMEIDGYLLHKDNKSLHDYLAKHNHYSTMEAFRILEERKEPIDWRNLKNMTEIKKVFYRLPFRNIAYFLYLYIYKFGFLDGKTGFRFIMTRINYQFDIDIKMKELQKRHILKEDYISFKK